MGVEGLTSPAAERGTVQWRMCYWRVLGARCFLRAKPLCEVGVIRRPQRSGGQSSGGGA